MGGLAYFEQEITEQSQLSGRIFIVRVIALVSHDQKEFYLK
jgi:hypothetical protein